MKRERWFLIGLIVVLFLLLAWQPSANLYLQSYLNIGDGGDAFRKLQTEYKALEANYALLKDLEIYLPNRSAKSLPAFVYAQYPLSAKSRFLVSIGKEHGVAVGQPVFFEKFLIGKVQEVFDRAATVLTVFDHSWQSAVRIGEGGVEALLVGGSQPRLTLVAKDARVKDGDVVISSASSFPYGVPVGEVASVGLSQDRLTQEADLRMPYDFRTVRVVQVEL